MRDAIGGVVNITIIVTFLVIVSGYLAFNVNYTKAFRVKNKIITNVFFSFQINTFIFISAVFSKNKKIKERSIP